MIAGLEAITGGTVAIDGEVVNDKEPRERGCAMVFQNYALYPHFTVAENIGYSLKVAGLPKAKRQERILAVARSVGLQDFLDRKPSQLSGGQRQRVAMARAMIREPKVFLFDEPLSNLDAKLRVQMRLEIRKLHQRLSATSVFVTHDQVEAMTLADRIVVMNQGRIEQIGTPAEIYERPETLFVASFIGSPPMNLFEATVQAQGSALTQGIMLRTPAFAVAAPGSSITLGSARKTWFWQQTVSMRCRPNSSRNSVPCSWRMAASVAPISWCNARPRICSPPGARFASTCRPSGCMHFTPPRARGCKSSRTNQPGGQRLSLPEPINRRVSRHRRDLKDGLSWEHQPASRSRRISTSRSTKLHSTVERNSASRSSNACACSGANSNHVRKSKASPRSRAW